MIIGIGGFMPQQLNIVNLDRTKLAFDQSIGIVGGSWGTSTAVWICNGKSGKQVSLYRFSVEKLWEMCPEQIPFLKIVFSRRGKYIDNFSCFYNLERVNLITWNRI